MFRDKHCITFKSTNLTPSSVESAYTSRIQLQIIDGRSVHRVNALCYVAGSAPASVNDIMELELTNMTMSANIRELSLMGVDKLQVHCTGCSTLSHACYMPVRYVSPGCFDQRCN